jgi:hypothetical protein
MSITRRGASRGRDTNLSANPQRAETPLSHAEELMWFLNQGLLEPVVYNVQISWRVEGSIDIACLRRAANRLVEWHEPS